MLLALQGWATLRGQAAVVHSKLSVCPFRFAEVVSSLLADVSQSFQRAEKNKRQDL